jgi:hypothetical protein
MMSFTSLDRCATYEEGKQRPSFSELQFQLTVCIQLGRAQQMRRLIDNLPEDVQYRLVNQVIPTDTLERAQVYANNVRSAVGGEGPYPNYLQYSGGKYPNEKSNSGQ